MGPSSASRASPPFVTIPPEKELGDVATRTIKAIQNAQDDAQDTGESGTTSAATTTSSYCSHDSTTPYSSRLKSGLSDSQVHGSSAGGRASAGKDSSSSSTTSTTTTSSTTTASDSE